MDSAKSTLPKLALPKIIKKNLENNLENSHQNDLKKKENAPWLTEGANLLEEVNLVGKKQSRQFKLIEKYRSLVFDIGAYYEVPLPDEFKDFKDDLMSFLNFDQSLELVYSSQYGEYYLTTPAGKEGGLYVDGKRITSYELNGLNIAMENIEAIMAQPFIGYTIYQVFTTENYKKNVEELFTNYVVKNGYDKATEYYQPIYDFDINKRKAWKEIDWKPNIETNAQGEAFIKVPKSVNTNAYFFSIQGLSEQGLLISETTTE